MENSQAEQRGDHLFEGGIYSVRPNQGGRGNFALAKVVRVDPEVVHVVIFSHTFRNRPLAAELGGLDLTLPAGVDEARSRHLALERKLFALMRPVYVATVAPRDEELSGLRRWSLLEGREIVAAPIYIHDENNAAVYTRIFLLCGLPFGALQGVYHYVKDGFVWGLVTFFVAFVLFGGLMTLMQFLAFRRRLKSAPSLLNGSPSAFQVAEVIVDRDFGETFSLCQQAIREVKNCRVLQEDYSGGTLEGRVGLSLTSEGEHIVLSLYRMAAGGTGVVVASVPRAGGDLDLGKNFENVSRIVGHLKCPEKYPEK